MVMWNSPPNVDLHSTKWAKLSIFEMWEYAPTSIEQASGMWAYALGDLRDRRVDDWPFMNTPYVNWAWLWAYFAFVYFGKKYMKGKEGLNLKWSIVAYNIFLVVLSIYMSVGIWVESVERKYTWVCNPVDYSANGERMLWFMWLYFFSKLIEFMDTVLYIVTGRLRQVTLLHVWHHSWMWPVWWIGVKYAGGGDSWFSACINSFIHVLMYSYYAVTAAGIKVPVSIKSLMTKLQLFQFVLVLIQSLAGIYWSCDYPLWMYEALAFFISTLLILFGNFYIQSYLRGKSGKKKKSA